MALDWLRMNHELMEKPEVMIIAESCGITIPHAVGCLFAVWCWIDRQSEDGTALGSLTVIDHLARQNGVGEAMVAVGWLVVDGRTLTFPKFAERVGKTARRRATENRRKSASRSKNAVSMRTQCGHDADTVRTDCGHDADALRPKNKNKNKSVYTPVDIPAASGGDTPDAGVGFDAWWAVYPKRNGKRGNKGQARAEWCKLDIETRRRVYFATKHLAHAVAHDGALAPDAQRFLTPPSKRAGADPRWLEWEDAKPEPKRTTNDRHLIGADGMDVLQKLQKREDALRATESPPKAKQA